MRALITAVIVCAAVLAGSGCGGLLYPKYTVTVRVVDEVGAPVEGAAAWASFSHLRTRNPWDGQDSYAVEGLTDAKGERVLRGRGLMEVRLGAEKDGYYPSRKNHMFGLNRAEKKDARAVTMELRLRKKIAPTAMYAKCFSDPLPRIGESIGYDLLAGDWVAPHGRGSVSDFIFTSTLDFRGRLDFDARVTMRFTRPGDGLAVVPTDQVLGESDLPLPQQAPEEGYNIRDVTWTYVNRPDSMIQKSALSGSCWYLRVRTEQDADGRVTKAMYGKITVKIALGLSMPGPIMGPGPITYYVNPDGTRNIEFDPKRNLIPNARDYEKPSAP